MISVIIPTFNRPRSLAACLQSLAGQRYPKNQFEVIVVDDGGEADLAPIIDPLHGSLDIRLVRKENSGPAGARNTGASHAIGEFVAFTDDDCRPAPDWLETLSGHLHRDPSMMYGGHTLNALEGNIYSSASQALIGYLYEYYNADPDQARFFTSNNMALSRRLFESIGGFDRDFPKASGEDRDLCDRWLHLGHGMCQVSEARVYHVHQMNLRSYWKQHFNYGTGAWSYWERKRLRNRPKPKIEPLSFYLRLVSYPWRKKLRQPVSLSALIVLAQIANALGYFREKFWGQ